MTQVVEPSLAERARAALERHDWRDAYDLLSEADHAGTLGPEELELLGQASWWVGRLPDAIAARERAYAGYVKEGKPANAAAVAIFVGRDNLLRNSHAVARAWLSRAERLIAALPESPLNGWLDATRAMQAGFEGDFDESVTRSNAAFELALRLGDPDLQAVALAAKGVGLIQLGRVDEGLDLVDEAAVPAVSGEITPMNAGAVSCMTISACASLGDWSRAGEWIEAQDRWCERERINGYPGMCRLHRAEAKQIHGAWTEAETEARRARDELAGFIPAAIGHALYQIGVIRLRRGDLPAAEEALLDAHARGRDPEPALSLLRLAEGRTDEAVAGIRRAIEEPPESTAWGISPRSELNLLALLPAQVDILLAAGDTAGARGAADRLRALVEGKAKGFGRAAAAMADGTVRLAEADATGAASSLRAAVRLWGEADAPWELARARLALAEAYAATGNRDGAVLELHAARSIFDRLGALPDLRRVDEQLAVLDSGAASGRGSRRSGGTRRERRVTRTFAFTDIVDSTKLAAVVGDEAWEGVIAWHDAAIRSLVAEHRGEEVKATGDGFFLAFPAPGVAIECGIAIQRRFADHRRTSGFAPAVRIGLHEAEATRSGLDYIGSGVNLAARIGAAAGANEILASAETIARAKAALSEAGRRSVELKGIERPIELVAIDWR